MDHTDVLDIRVYIPMLLIFLIPISLIRNLKYLVPFSAVANIFILISFVITLYYIFKDSLDIGDLENIANVQQLPLFFATVIFAMEGIGVVSMGHALYGTSSRNAVFPLGRDSGKTKLRGLSPQVNYIDRATAACQRS
jgi:amino acid permease